MYIYIHVVQLHTIVMKNRRNQRRTGDGEGVGEEIHISYEINIFKIIN